MWMFRKVTEFHKQPELGLGVSSHETGDCHCSSASLISCRQRQCSHGASLDLCRIYLRAGDIKAEWILLIPELIHFTKFRQVSLFSLPLFPQLQSAGCAERTVQECTIMLQVCDKESQGGADIEFAKLLPQVIQDWAYLTPLGAFGFWVAPWSFHVSSLP